MEGTYRASQFQNGILSWQLMLQLVCGSNNWSGAQAIESVMRSHVGSSLLQSILDSQGWRIQNVKLTLDEPPQHIPFVRPTPAAVESKPVSL